MLDHHLAPGIDVVLVRPAGVEGLDVEVEIGAAELQQMQHEQRQIGMGEGGVVGHRAGPGHPRIELAQIDLAALLVDQEIELEIAAIAFLAQLLAEAEGQVAGMGADARR